MKENFLEPDGNSTSRIEFSEFQTYFTMLTSNMFRPIPFDPNEPKNIDNINSQKRSIDKFDDSDEFNIGLDYEEDFSSSQKLFTKFPEWEVLDTIYSLFLNFLINEVGDKNRPGGNKNSKNSKERELAATLISDKIVRKFLSQMNTKCYPERTMIKIILHKIYELFIERRDSMRTSICNIFQEVIYENKRHYGTCGLLEIICAIISGAIKPIRQSYKEIIYRSVMPLLSSDYFHFCKFDIFKCINEFLTTELENLPKIVNLTLKFWPKINRKEKEIWFLQLYEFIFTNIIFEQDQLDHGNNIHGKSILIPNWENYLPQEILSKIIIRIIKSIYNSLFLVSERALNLLTNENILALIELKKFYLIPKILKEISKFENVHYESSSNVKFYSSHWSEEVQGNFETVLHCLFEMDYDYYEKCAEVLDPDQMKVSDSSQADKSSLSPLTVDNTSDDTTSRNTSINEISVSNSPPNYSTPSQTIKTPAEEPLYVKNSKPQNKNSNLKIGINAFPSQNPTYNKSNILKDRLRNDRNSYIEFDRLDSELENNLDYRVLLSYFRFSMNEKNRSIGFTGFLRPTSFTLTQDHPLFSEWLGFATLKKFCENALKNYFDILTPMFL